jgi:hypothetical protein
LNEKCIENELLITRLNDCENEKSKELVEHQNAIQELNLNKVKTFDDMKSAFELEVDNFKAKINELEIKLEEKNENLIQLTRINCKIEEISRNLFEKSLENETNVEKLQKCEFEKECQLTEHQKNIVELNLNMTNTVNEMHSAFELKIRELVDKKQQEAEKFMDNIKNVGKLLSEYKTKFVKTEHIFNEKLVELNDANGKINDISFNLSNKNAENELNIKRLDIAELEKQRLMAEFNQNIERLNGKVNELSNALNELYMQKQSEAEQFKIKIGNLEGTISETNSKFGVLSVENKNLKAKITENELRIA